MRYANRMKLVPADSSDTNFTGVELELYNILKNKNIIFNPYKIVLINNVLRRFGTIPPEDDPPRRPGIDRDVQTDDYNPRNNSRRRRTSGSVPPTIKREVVTPVPPDELDAEEDVEVSDRGMQTEINDLPSPSLPPSARNVNPPPRPRPYAIYNGPKPPTMAKKRRLIEGPPYVVKIPRVDGKNVGPRQNMEIFANDVQMGTLPVSTVNLASNWTEI
jgi:hypothetical protein